MSNIVYILIFCGITASIWLLLDIPAQLRSLLSDLRGRKSLEFLWQSPGERKAGLEERFPILKQKKQEKMEEELYQGVSYLRNLTMIEKGRRLSADGVLEQLARKKGELQPVYIRMLQLLRQNQKGEAAACFEKNINSDFGKTLGRLLIQWDDLPPENLTETLLSHQRNIREVRMTKQKKRDETISDLIYLPVVVNVMLIFINFIYVGYFIDQKDMFQMFF